MRPFRNIERLSKIRDYLLSRVYESIVYSKNEKMGVLFMSALNDVDWTIANYDLIASL